MIQICDKQTTIGKAIYLIKYISKQGHSVTQTHTEILGKLILIYILEMCIIFKIFYRKF